MEPRSTMMPGAARSTPKRRTRKYIVIRDWIAERIASGDFARGERLPSEHDLMDRFEVSRVTARQALDDLRRKGIVDSQRGKGYFVSRPKAVSNLQQLQSFGEMMAPLGLKTHSNVIELLEVPATKEIAEALRIAQRTPVTRIVRTRIAGGAIVSLDVSFFPLDIGRPLMKLDLAKEDVFLLLERQLGIELGYADLSIDVVAAEEKHARHIGAKLGESVLRIRRTTHDDNGRPIDYERLYARLDAMQFRVRIPRG